MQSNRTVSQMVLPNRILLREVAGLLEEGQAVTLLAKGESMRPFIRGGKDKVVLRKAESWSVGDIVLASLANGGYVLHRIYRIDKEGIRLMGDGNCRETELCRPDNIVGKVERIIREERQTVCGSAAERRKASVWRKLLPVRRYLLYLLRLRDRWAECRQKRQNPLPQQERSGTCE